MLQLPGRRLVSASLQNAAERHVMTERHFIEEEFAANNPWTTYDIKQRRLTDNEGSNVSTRCSL